MTLYNTGKLKYAINVLCVGLFLQFLFFSAHSVYAIDTDGGYVVVPFDPISGMEGGASSEISTALVNPPDGEVEITVVSSDESIVSIDIPTLTFDSSNWGALQSFELIFPQDNNDIEDKVTLTFSAQSNSPFFVVNSVQTREVVVQDTQPASSLDDLEPDEPIFGGPQDDAENSDDLSSGDLSDDVEYDFLVPSEPIFGGPQDSQEQSSESNVGTATSQDTLIRTGGQDM